MTGIMLLCVFLCATVLYTRLLGPRHRVESLLIAVVVGATLIFLTANIISSGNQLRQVGWWVTVELLALAAGAAPLVFIPSLRARCLRPWQFPQDLILRVKRARIDRFHGGVLIALGGTVLVTTVANLIVLVGLEPATMDGLQYHLPRMAYYLQHGNLNFFGANYWAEVIHPKVATTLMIFAYQVASGCVRYTQLPQLLAYFTTMLAIYAVSRELGGSRRGSLCAALLFGLLVISLMEAVTTQNDLVLTAFAGCQLYFMLAYRREPRRTYLWLAAIAFALALGVKSTMLSVLPSFAIVGWWLWRSWKDQSARLPSPKPAARKTEARQPRTLVAARHLHPHVWVAAAALAIGLVFITLPAGYWENLRYTGSLFGPKSVNREHTLADVPPAELLRVGMLNVLRYGFDGVTPDGLLPFSTLRTMVNVVQFPPFLILHALGINLEADEGARYPFRYERSFVASENYSGWGVLGCLLIWPLLLWMLCRRDTSTVARTFALAALVYFLVQAFISPYDIWRGRYFTTAALFALPPLALTLFPVRVGRMRWYLAGVVALACLSALFAVTYRAGTYLVPCMFCDQHIPSSFTRESSLTLTRAKQLARQDTEADPAAGIERYEQLVPLHATVAVDLVDGPPEFYFFGEGLTRRLIPLHPLVGAPQPIPPDADYLLYDSPAPAKPRRKGDIALYSWHSTESGGTVYLRRLANAQAKGS